MIATDQIKMMGTIIDIYIDSSKAKQQAATIRELLTLYNHRFSANDDSSELMAINHMAGIQPVRVHSDLFDLISIGKEHSLAYPSNLNITLGPLVQSWRIGFSDAKLPDEATIDRRLRLTNPNHIILNQSLGSIFLKEKGMSIDLGALAKGYIADKLMAFLIKDGITAALINLGGNVLVHGTNKQRHNGLFYVGIQQPNQKRGQHTGVIKVNNSSVVTSGINERQLRIEDKTYHHLLDPHTGYPIKTNMASLTIVSPSSLDGELWSTRLFGLEHSFVLNQLNRLPEVEGIIITKDGQVTISDGLQEAFRLHYKH